MNDKKRAKRAFQLTRDYGFEFQEKNLSPSFDLWLSKTLVEEVTIWPTLLAATVYVRAERLREDRVGRRIREALVAACEAVGFEFEDEEAPTVGSWFQRIRIRAAKLWSDKEVQTRLAKVERALDLKMIDGVQSKIDLDLSKAAVQLANALRHAEVGIISVGSLFVVKTTRNGESRIAILSLTQEQMKLVRDHPAMQTDPDVFYRMLGTSATQAVLANATEGVERPAGAEPPPSYRIDRKKSSRTKQ